MRRRRLRLPLTEAQRRIAAGLQGLATGSVESAPPDPTTNWAAVAVIVAPDPDAVLLIRRAERSGDPWSGHIGLPGGRLDPADQSLRDTALRETREEIGWRLEPGQTLGVLPDVWPRTPLPRLIVVRPFVIAASTRPPLILSEEVAEAFWVPLAELRDPAVYRETLIELRGERRQFPAFHIGRHVVWGLTERILTPLLDLVQG
ncbi:MAG TPA: CoA pyrophosphatase [Gemmatimonadales bacterium]|nr:CoA pyrophosphatase [Gemmatimonadales bacterium]